LEDLNDGKDINRPSDNSTGNTKILAKERLALYELNRRKP